MYFNQPNPQAQMPRPMYPFFQNQTFQYAQMSQPKMTQTLTPEQINRLRQSGGGFSLQIPENEMLAALCTHKNNGQFDMIRNGDGTVTCKICGQTFNLLKRSQDEVKEATDVILDFLQSTKTMYLDIPEETARQYFQIIPLINRLPALYKLAVDDFAKYNGGTDLYNQNVNNGGFSALANLVSPAMGMGMPIMAGMMPDSNGAYPYMGYPQPQQMQPQVPVQQNPVMGGNPFGYYGAPAAPMYSPNMQMGQMPVQQNPAMGMNMNSQQQATAPAAPQAQASQPEAPVVQQTKQMNV